MAEALSYQHGGSVDSTRRASHAHPGECRHPDCRGHSDDVTAEHGLEQLLRMHSEGASPTTIAAALNRAGFRTPRGLRWHRVSVRQVVEGTRSAG